MQKVEATARPPCTLDSGGSRLIERKSPANICIRKNSAFIEMERGELFNLGGGLFHVPVEVEIRAQVCPFCLQSQTYVTVNGHVIIGHLSALISNGKHSDCCDDPRCIEKQSEWHDAGLERPAVRSGPQVRSEPSLGSGLASGK